VALPEDAAAKVLSDLLVECREDFVEVWSVLWMVRYELCGGDYPMDVYERTDSAEVRRLALEVIAALLERGARAGFYADASPGEYPPPLSIAPPAVVIGRLVAEWEQLGHEPSMGELAGFTSLPLKTAEPSAADVTMKVKPVPVMTDGKNGCSSELGAHRERSRRTSAFCTYALLTVLNRSSSPFRRVARVPVRTCVPDRAPLLSGTYP